MSSTKSKRHIHKYHRVDFSGTKHWACAMPDCMHYMPKHLENMVEGKNTFCWECNSIFALDKEAMASDKPLCISCRHPEVVDDSKLMEMLKGRI